MKKNLAIITTHPIQYQVPLFKHLKRKGIKIKVFFASKHGLNKKETDPEFLRKIKWNINSNLLQGYESKFSKIQKYKINDFRLNYYKVEKELINGNYNYILILGWNNLHYLRAIRYAMKEKIKIILRVETNLVSTKNFFKNIFKNIFLRIFFKKVSYFLSIGKLNKKFYLHHGVPNKKILPAPYFVDNNFFNSKLNKKKLKKNFNLKSKKIILFVGKLIDRKNPFEFLELAKINKNNLNFHFIILGDGYLKKKCCQFIKYYNLKNVSLLGFVNQKEIRKYYKVSDLMISTSLYETWGLTINEAFASHIPVICTNACGCSLDLVDNGKTGFIYKRGDIQNLNKKTQLILNNNKISTKMIKNIKKKIKNYSLIHTSNSISKILNEK
jgi:glycosyltransferase involved in cell wall biosynthesis